MLRDVQEWLASITTPKSDGVQGKNVEVPKPKTDEERENLFRISRNKPERLDDDVIF